jgi:uncharacterized membrane protein YjjP (DUF1212 family)
MRRDDAARPERRTARPARAARAVALALGVLGLAGAALGALGGPALADPAASVRPAASPAATEVAAPVAPEPSGTATAPVAVPDPTPTATPSAEPTAEPSTPAPAPSASEPAPAPSSTPEPSTSPTAGTGTTDEDGAGSARRTSRPPAVTTSTTPWPQLIGALLVVAGGAVAVAALSARRARAEATGSAAAVVPPGDEPAEAPPSPDDVLRLLVAAGEAMVDAGHTVSSVDDTLAQIAEAYGIPDVETVVLPTALLVSVPHDGTVSTAAVSTGREPLHLHQVDELADVLHDAAERTAGPSALAARIAALRAGPPPFGTLARLGGYLLLSVGLAALLGGSWVDFLVAGALGLAVGAVQLAARPMPSGIEVAGTVLAALGVGTVVLLLARTVPDLGVLPSIIAPLALFLPGGLLTTGVIELATGQMLSGAGRLAAGTMQLALLAGGIVAAAALVGVPEIDLSGGDQPLGPVAPWVGVVLFGVGTVVFRCGRPQTIGWVVLVLAVAYGAQVVGGALLGGTLSAFVGAFAMTPVALAVARFPSGPSPLASFLPAFWMLVPGALGLVGVATLLDGDATGLSTLVTTAVTMLSIAIGVLLGLAVSRELPGGPGGRRRGTAGLPGVAIARPRTDRPWVATLLPRRTRGSQPPSEDGEG